MGELYNIKLGLNWALGKVVLELVGKVPERISLHCEKTVPVNKEPAPRLIYRMMQDEPS